MKINKFAQFYLDLEKDIIVELYKENDRLFYVLRTPNHHTGNLISNLAKLCDLKLSKDENDLKIIKGEIPAYIDGNNNRIYIFRLGNTKVANIYDDGRIEMKASIPAISKTLMSQTKDYKLDIKKTIIKTYIQEDYKFSSDFHVHMNGILSPDILIALGIYHQIRYPLYYVRKLNLVLTPRQNKQLINQRKKVSKQFENSSLKGKYLERRIDDNTYINFADLILNNIYNMKDNISKIRASLSIMKDGQAVFTNLEKVYLYRYVFTKAIPNEKSIELKNINKISDKQIKESLLQMIEDHSGIYEDNSLFKDKLLWIARTYRNLGINYVEISDTTLVKPYLAVKMLREVHEVMPKIFKETGVYIRFLAAIRRTPLTIIKDSKTDEDYLSENISVLNSVAIDPYVAGCDFVGEEINDIRELKDAFNHIVRIAKKYPGFVIRIHAGENDSLTDNVYNSIKIVRDCLAKKQRMPKLRIGHGLYTANLNSKKGRELIKMIKDNNVTLEFQISSNVRLNNLTNLEAHPLKKYLDKDLDCVVGTDGMALYGTNCIDEQLSLEKLLELNSDDLLKIKNTETRLVEEGILDFKKKEKKFNNLLAKKEFTDIFINTKKHFKTRSSHQDKYIEDSVVAFKEKIKELPWDRYPIVIAGGSFNSQQRKTKINKRATLFIDELLDKLNPDEVFFVIGDSIDAYEKYLIRHNKKGFKIFAIVPNYVDINDKNRILKEKINIRISPERQMGLYKSFNYEIFERRPSIVIAYDGNSAGFNLIQEARNGKGKSSIYIYQNSPLIDKAESLYGYVKIFEADEYINDVIKKIREKD